MRGLRVVLLACTARLELAYTVYATTRPVPKLARAELTAPVLFYFADALFIALIQTDL